MAFASPNHAPAQAKRRAAVCGIERLDHYGDEGSMFRPSTIAEFQVSVQGGSGYVQVPCIERCAYGAVKAWTGYCIASAEVPDERRVDLDTTIAAMALTAKEMNSKYKETSEGGLAVSVVLC